VDSDSLAGVAGARVRYDRGGLRAADLGQTWLDQFRRWYDEAAAAPEIAEPNAMVVATATPDGVPSARTVLLKDAGPDGLTFFTHYTSRKGHELAANPWAAVVFPWHPVHRQVRLEGGTEQIPAAASDAYWDSRPYGSRIGALASPQSDVVSGRDALQAARAAAQEAHPGPEVPRPATWGGYLLRPDVVEFWQGRPDRLHDRLRFRVDGGRWLVERLGP
jgi:pyridoxamine 5'-phosphate oxidase